MVNRISELLGFTKYDILIEDYSNIYNLKEREI